MLVENEISILNALRRISNLTDASCAMLTLPAPEGQSFHPLRAYLEDLLPEDSGSSVLLQAAPEITKAVLETKQPVCHHDLSGEYATIAGFPVTLRGDLNTVFLIGWHEGHSPDISLTIMSGLVDMLRLVLDAHLAYYAEQYYIQSLEYLGNFSTELNVIPDIPTMIKRAAHTGAVLLNSKHYVANLEKQQLPEQVHYDGVSADFAYWFAEMALAIDILKIPSPSVGIEYTRIIRNDSDGIPETWLSLFKKEGIQSSLVTVLHSNNQIFGSLWILYDQPYTPTDYDVRLLEILAAQTAVALENIELNAANIRSNQELEHAVHERTSELAIALDKAQDADRLKTQLLSTVSHELRTPLAVIKAHATTMLRYYDKLPVDRHMHYLGTINEESDRLTEMISSLLDMSRLEAGMLDIQTIAFEPLDLLRNFVTVMQPRYTDRTITTNLPDSIRPIKADPERLRQLLANLVENASKYSPPGSTIEIGARCWDDALELWVRDHGNGLTAEQLNHVFDRFYQVNARDPKSSRSGVGLGLAIAKGLIEAMGGRIWVESAGLNQGSRFAFTIPWAKKEEVRERVE